MTSSAQIAYPAQEDDESPAEEARGENVAESPEEGEASHEPLSEESAASDPDDAEGAYVHRESGRPFDVSPEEFCADPYREQENRESRMELGRKGEEAAVRYLEARGFDILKRNWFCRFGEADVIARDPDGAICFIEVKTRRSIEAGMPEEAITAEKRKRYERIALCWMMASDEWDDNDEIRFDAICICVTGPHRALLRHHRGCFNASV